MPLAAWPSSVHHQPERGSWTMDLNSGNVQSDMDGGNTLTRRRFWNTPTRQTISWLFQGAEFAVFMGFWSSTLDRGTRSFRLNVWDGSAYQLLTCKFVGEDPKPESVANSSTDTRVAATVEVRGMGWLDAGATWLVGEYGEDFVVEFSDTLDRVVNVQMPEALANQGAT